MRVSWLMLIAPLVLGGLAGCEPQSTQQEREEAACRAQTNVVDNKLNRDDIAQPDTSATPLSAGGLPGINTAPVIERQTHDQLMLDCLNGTGPLPTQ